MAVAKAVDDFPTCTGCAAQLGDSWCAVCASRAPIEKAVDIVAGLLAVIPMTAFANPSTQVAIDSARAFLAKNGAGAITKRDAIAEAWAAAHPYTPREEP